MNIRSNSGQHVAERGQRQVAATRDKDGRRITRLLNAEERAAQLVTVKVVTTIVGGGPAGFRANNVTDITILHR